MGGRITKLSHHQGFAASTGGSIMVFTASLLGIPVSTTHTITGSIIGAGVARRASAVRWGVAGNVVAAWFITIPASAAVAAVRSEEHTSELQSLMRISYAVFCLQKTSITINTISATSISSEETQYSLI